MTEKLYLAGDEASCETTVTATGTDDAGTWVCTAKTVFHPQGGGQKSDRGTIAGVLVAKVVHRNGEVFHYLDRPSAFAVGQPVTLEIDRAWRHLHSRWHNAGHLLAALLESLFPDLKAVAGHHWPGEGRIEAVGDTFPNPGEVQTKLDQAVQEAIAQNLPVKIAGDAFHSRAIQIADYAPVPCGGTHPKGTGELGVVRVRGVKVKGGKLRLSYDVEDPS